MTIASNQITATLDVPEGFVDVPAHDVVLPEVDLLSQDFEDGDASAWDDYYGGTVSITTGERHSGTRSLHFVSAAGVGDVWAERAIPVGYLPPDGRVATITFWIKGPAGGFVDTTPAAGDGFTETELTGSWQQVTYHPTVVTGDWIGLDIYASDGSDFEAWIDDVTVQLDAVDQHYDDHTATSAVLDVVAGSATLDEGWAPYGQASLTIALPSDAVLNQLDPRLSHSIRIRAARSTWAEGSSWGSPVIRDLTLLIRGRVVDHNAATVTLTLTTKEALLQDARLVATAPSTALLPYQSSVRTICTQVLARHGFTLAAGTTDADFTTLTSVTNLFDNPSAEVDLTDATSTNLTSLVRQTGTTWAAHSTAFRLNGASASSDSWMNVGGDTGALRNGMQAGHTYTISGIFHIDAALGGTAIAARARAINVVTVSPTGGTVITSSAQAANVAGTTTRLKLTVTIPKDATTACIRFYHGHAGTSTAYWSDLMLVEGNGMETDTVNPIAFFDGDTAATLNYTYAWSGTAGKSISTRTPRFSRTPDALTQQPGTSDWELITPVLQQTGLRLFCDEAGTWRLVDNTYSVYGRVSVSEGFNAYRAQDTINRDEVADDGSPLWFDACVIKYSWIDSTGAQQVAWDAYAATGYSQVAYFEKAYAYPGPGMAKYYVGRVNGHGRTLALTAAVDFTATPGMEVVSSLAGTEDQTGYVSSVAWDFEADEMTVGTRGLVDTPASAWIELAPGESWLASPAGASWTAETV